MFDALITWMQEPGKWNDAIVVCVIFAVVSVGYMINQGSEDR